MFVKSSLSRLPESNKRFVTCSKKIVVAEKMRYLFLFENIRFISGVYINT